MLTPDQAEAIILESVRRLEQEHCPLESAAGRILREPLVADRDLPPFDRATMDGFAVRSADLEHAASLRVTGMQAAGAAQQTLGPAGTCLEIATGAVLPQGADTVLPYEECIRKGDAVALAPNASWKRGGSIHRQGDDAKAGAVLVPAGRAVGGREAAVAASCGYSVVTVTRLPRIAIVATGDELVSVATAQPLTHQVRRSNDQALQTALTRLCPAITATHHLPDVRDEVVHRLRVLLTEFDAILLTGGVSKGKFDFLPSVLDELGVPKKIQGVAQRPGKPFWFGVSSGGVPVFALPGNPVSTFTCFHRFFVPALRAMLGANAVQPTWAALACEYTFGAPLAPLLPVRCTLSASARAEATPAPTHTSGDFAGLVPTDGFIELPPGPATYSAGTLAKFWPWQPSI